MLSSCIRFSVSHIFQVLWRAALAILVQHPSKKQQCCEQLVMPRLAFFSSLLSLSHHYTSLCLHVSSHLGPRETSASFRPTANYSTAMSLYPTANYSTPMKACAGSDAVGRYLLKEHWHSPEPDHGCAQHCILGNHWEENRRKHSQCS